MESGRKEVDLTVYLFPYFLSLSPPEKAMKVKREGDMK